MHKLYEFLESHGVRWRPFEEPIFSFEYTPAVFENALQQYYTSSHHPTFLHFLVNNGSLYVYDKDLFFETIDLNPEFRDYPNSLLSTFAFFFDWDYINKGSNFENKKLLMYLDWSDYGVESFVQFNGALDDKEAISKGYKLTSLFDRSSADVDLHHNTVEHCLSIVPEIAICDAMSNNLLFIELFNFIETIG